MKKIFLLCATVALLGACSYDDDDLWNKVNSLDGRVESLEKSVKQFNSDITAMQKIVKVLNAGKVITSSEQITDGYKLTFSDQTSIELKNGKNGTNGTNAPVIGVKDSTDGLYYWTITTDGKTEYLTVDAKGTKLLVSGRDGAAGVTPVMGVDKNGYWTVDTGTGATQLKDASGKTVKAQGSDGKNGDSFFKSVTEQNDQIVLTLADGSVFTLPKASALSITFEQVADRGVMAGKSKVFALTFNKVDYCSVMAVSNEWTATLKDTNLTVVAPSTLTEQNRDAEVKLLISDAEGNCKMVKFGVYAYQKLTLLTFEDADYTGEANYLGFSDWSSLIDPSQYGGKLLYGASGSGPTDYRWKDNVTMLASEFPTNYGTTCYWGGGHAVSNYVETDLKKGDYMHQLAVPCADAVTGKGGHGGSSNFCVHFGYKDNSSWNKTTALPYIYFSDQKERAIESLYVAPTTYLLNVETNGNGLSAPAGEDDWIKLTAIGYTANGSVSGKAEFYLANKGGFVKEWTKWDLTSLGKVQRVEFNIGGSNDNGYGFSQPAYFAYDDVAVRF